jgi:Glycosyl transferase family 2/Uncharacterized conserved protein (DUF2304)
VSTGLRQALVLALGGAVLAGAIVVLVRKRLISTRYALGWLAIAVLVILGAAFTGAVSSVGDVAGMTPTAVFLAAATILLLTITIQLSISVSGLQSQLRDLTEANALLDERVRAMGSAPSAGSAVLPRTLVVVPAHNESATIADVVSRVTEAGLDCFVVDDGSDDETAVLAGEAGATTLRLPVRLAVGGALRSGFRYAVAHGYDRVVQCDGDGQHPPELIDQLLGVQQATGAQLVIGSRFLPGAQTFPLGAWRRLVMRWFSFLVRARSGVDVKDTTSGFRCIAQPLLGEFARSFPTHFLGDTFEAVLVAARAGYPVAECPTRIDARPHGESTASFAHSVQAIVRATVVAVGGITFRIRPCDDQAPPRSRDRVEPSAVR